MSTPSENTLVIIPTYNEAENTPLIVGRLRKAEPDIQVLIVDDNSPDGTGEVADRLAAEDDFVHVLHNEEKGGLLKAYIAGFQWGIEHGFDVLCEMDADGSHAPEQLHLLLEQIDDGAELVIGSRYLAGGKVVNWPKSRWLLSKAGNLYISAMLGAGLTDMTAGFRAYRRSLLESLDLDELSNAGYIFQVDIARHAVNAGADVREVPITFTEREIGESKMDASFVTSSLSEVTKWGLKYRGEQLTALVTEMSKLSVYELQLLRKKYL